MKIKTIAISLGLTAAMAGGAVQAGGFSPLAADRYGMSTFVSAEAAVEQEAEIMLPVEPREPKQSYQPFVANSYKAAPFKLRASRDEVESDVQVGKIEGSGFQIFSSDRYYK